MARVAMFTVSVILLVVAVTFAAGGAPTLPAVAVFLVLTVVTMPRNRRLDVAVGLAGLAVAAAAATLAGTAMPTPPSCTDPPCGDTKYLLEIYGLGATVVFGGLAALVAAAHAVSRARRRAGFASPENR